MNIRPGRSRFLNPVMAASVFLLSRVLLRAAGVRFEAAHLGSAWQFLDMAILKQDLIRGVFYQHSQPPLFNLFLGMILQLFPGSYVGILAMLFHLAGLAIHLLLYRILRILDFRPWVALALATFFLLTPQAILYEHWLFYTWPIAALLLCCAYTLRRYEQTLRLRHAALFLGGIGVLCLTRSLFHPVYLAAASLLLLSIRSNHRRTLAVLSLCVLLMVGAVFLKNLFLFDFFGSSSWVGMNLWKVAGDPAVTSVQPFSDLAAYPEEYRQVPARFSEIPALAEETKQNGALNFNHFGYIGISEEYRTGALASISKNPSRYLRRVFLAWGVYSFPAWEYGQLGANRNVLREYIEVTSLASFRMKWEHRLFGIDHPREFPLSSLLLIPVALALVLAEGAIRLVRLLRGEAGSGESRFFLYLLLTILYTALLGNCLEIGENHRFRVQTDPLLYLGVILSIRRVWQWAFRPSEATPPGTTARRLPAPGPGR